jgi:hypothetical protein
MSRRVPLAAALAAALVAIAVAAALLTSRGSDRQASASTGSSSTDPPAAGTLVPATSRFPAAGVCGRVSGDVVTVRIEPDTPEPRCASVDDRQSLRVVNATGEYGQSARTVTVAWIPGQPFALRPGESKTFPQHFGDYLARGVHDLRVGSAYQAEIWLH